MTRIKRHSRKNFDLFASYTWFTPGWNGIACLTLWFLVGALLGNIVSVPLLLLFEGAEDASLYAELVAYPVMFIPPMIYAVSKSRANSFFSTGYKMSNRHYKPLGAVFCAVAVVLATLALGFVSDIFTCILPPMPEWLEEMMESLTGSNIWINLLSVSVFAPFFEEWLCRGMVLRGLLNFEHKDKATGEVKHGIKPVWAIVASAAFFAIIHLNPWQAIPAFLLGCLFGYVYYKTGSIRLTMLMHCTNNTFAVILANIDSLKDIDGWMDLLPTFPYVAVFVFCTALVLYVVSKFGQIEPLTPQGSCEATLAE